MQIPSAGPSHFTACFGAAFSGMSPLQTRSSLPLGFSFTSTDSTVAADSVPTQVQVLPVQLNPKK
jgi:hypothetical protein